MLRLKVTIKDRQIYLDGVDRILPIRGGSRGKLILRSSDIEDETIRAALTREEKYSLLAADTKLMSFVRNDQPPSPLIRGLNVSSPPNGTGAGYVEIQLKETLFLEFKPPRPPTLMDCRCWIPSLAMEVSSVNEGHTRISEHYEKHRRSHHGNVFLRVFVEMSSNGGRWIPLEELRQRVSAQFDAETARRISNAPTTSDTPMMGDSGIVQATEQAGRKPFRPRASEISRVVQALGAAQIAGQEAAQKLLLDLRARYGDSEPYDLLAGACLNLTLTTRSRIGRTLLHLDNSLPHVFRAHRASRNCIIVGLVGMTGRQEQCIQIAAEEAALAVLEKRLGVEGYVTSYAS